MNERKLEMGVYEELVARGLIAQVTDEKEIRELVNSGKAVFYIGEGDEVVAAYDYCNLHGLWKA